MSFPTEEKIVEAQMASQYMLALTEGGSVYSWGKNTSSTCEVCVCVCADVDVVSACIFLPCPLQLGYEVSSIQTTPKLVERLAGKGIKQVRDSD